MKAEEADTLFKSDEVIRIELRTDFSAIQKDRLKLLNIMMVN